MPAVGVSYPFFIMGIVYDSIKNENNLDLDPEQSAKFLSLVSSAFFFGLMGAPFFIPYCSKTDTKKTQRILVFIFAIVNLLFIYPNMYVMALGRFLQGLVGRLLHVTNLWWIRQIALPKHRNVSQSFPLIAYSTTGVLFYFLSFLDDGGQFFWRLIVVIPTIVMLSNLVVDLIMVKNLNSFTFLLQNSGYDTTLEKMKLIYEEETAKQLTMEFHASNSKIETAPVSEYQQLDKIQYSPAVIVQQGEVSKQADENEGGIKVNKPNKFTVRSIATVETFSHLPNI